MFKKHLTILMVIILLAVVGLVFSGCVKGKYSSPEQTLSLLIKAVEEGDVEAYQECFTEESQETLKLLAITPEWLKTEGVESYVGKFKVTEKTGDRAVMTSQTARSRILVFKKEEGNWKIDFKERSRDNIRLSSLRQLRLALEMYYDQHGAYPALNDTSEDGEFLRVLRDFIGNFLDPLHPKYFYEYEGTENSYTLKCYCEIEGDNCDIEDGIYDHAFTFTFPK